MRPVLYLHRNFNVKSHPKTSENYNMLINLLTSSALIVGANHSLFQSHVEAEGENFQILQLTYYNFWRFLAILLYAHLLYVFVRI